MKTLSLLLTFLLAAQAFAIDFGTPDQVYVVPHAGGRAQFGQVDLTKSAALKNQLAVGNGGTGLASGTSGGIPYFNATSTMASSGVLSATGLVLGGGAGGAPTTITGTADQVCREPHAGGAPAFGSLDLSQSATVGSSVLPVANGGTGQSTLAANALLVGNGTSGVTTLSAGSAGVVQSSGSAFSVVSGSVKLAGEIFMWAGSTCPTGSVAADGSSLAQSGTYASLFAAIGSVWGTADGTHFNVPDFRGLFPRGAMTLTTVSGSGSASSNNATFASHGLVRTGIKVQVNSGTLSGLSTATTYYAIVIDANTLAFATTRANALAGTKIAISGTNSAVIQQWEDPDASTRLASTVGGATGAAIGTYEDDQLVSHTHSVFVDGQAGTVGGATGKLMGPGSTTTGATGGNETRGKNLSVLFCVQY